MRNRLFLFAAVFVIFTGTAQAEESGQKNQLKQHHYQPGQGYEQEPEYKFSGKITKIPENSLSGIWVINNDRQIVVSPTTNIKQEKGKAIVGASVAVKGVLQGSNFVATEIEVTTDTH